MYDLKHPVHSVQIKNAPFRCLPYLSHITINLRQFFAAVPERILKEYRIRILFKVFEQKLAVGKIFLLVVT